MGSNGETELTAVRTKQADICRRLHIVEAKLTVLRRDAHIAQDERAMVESAQEMIKQRLALIEAGLDNVQRQGA